MSGYWPSLQTVSDGNLLESSGLPCYSRDVLFGNQVQAVENSGGCVPDGQPGLK
jgi:hypothetical protein